MVFSWIRIALGFVSLLLLFSCNSSDTPSTSPSRIEEQKQIEEFVEAARKGQSHTIILMLDNGMMNRQAALDKGLMAALEEEHNDLAAFLLNRGADPKAKNSGSFTALMEAAMLGDFHLVRQLVELGADPHAIDNEGRTALMSVVAGGNLEAVDVILSLKPKVNAQDKAGFTALIWAATGNHPEIGERLIEYGANVNIRDRNGYSALWLATLRENLDTARVLVDKG
ncbi:MAG: ankyrin repeat domain-containing protein, partial [Nitrospinaceae bacterium]